LKPNLKPEGDNQKSMLTKKDRSNLAGEFHTLAELYRRGYNAFITLGKSKQIDIVVKDGDESVSIEVKSRMSSGQFLCSSPSSPNLRKIWVFVDMNKKSVNDPPDYYILSAKDLYKIGKNRKKEIKKREKASGKKYSELSSLDITLNNLKEYNKGWDLVKTVFARR
jgi:hypothetical protein